MNTEQVHEPTDLYYFCGAVISAGAYQTALGAQNVYVGTCIPGKADYPTIQAAVSKVTPGSTVNVCPGTYPEQISISKPLNLKTVTIGTSAQVTVTAPAGNALVPTVPFMDGAVAQIAVSNIGGAANITGITVDGTGLSKTSSLAAGIAYNATLGTIKHVSIRNLSPAGGESVGIDIEDDYGSSPTVNIEDSSVDATNATNFTSGISAYTAQGTLTLAVSDSVVVGATSGIDVFGHVAATISRNVIFNTFQQRIAAGATTTTKTRIEGNTIAGHEDDVAFYNGSAPVSVMNNRLVAAPGQAFSESGINFEDCQLIPFTASGNTFINTATAIKNVPEGQSFQKAAGSYVNVPNIESVCAY